MNIERLLGMRPGESPETPTDPPSPFKNIAYRRAVGEDGEDTEIVLTAEANGLGAWYRDKDRFGLLGFVVGDVNARNGEMHFSAIDFITEFKHMHTDQIKALVKMVCDVNFFPDEVRGSE